MLKFIIFVLCMTPLIKKFWLTQSLSFFLSFVVMMTSWGCEISLIGYGLGVDIVSTGFIVLTVWIISLMFMASSNIKLMSNYTEFFSMLLLLLLLFLFVSFCTLNYLLFYFMFESSLIPTLILILGWGYQPERILSGYYLLFYTLCASLPLLMVILYLYSLNGSVMFYILKCKEESLYTYLSLIMAFLVKLPMFMFHLWLPKAHVEAPVAGSMILAGILLKLGGYGLIRVMTISSYYFSKYGYLWISVSLYGGVVISLICMLQSDMKSMIAYSSVGHMGLVLMGIMTMFSWGLNGAYLLMLGHGLCSSGLFCASNIIYERLSSRSFFINKGLISFMPSMTLFWFLLCSSNMASPPSLNLGGEIMIINSTLSWSSIATGFLMVLSFFSAVYSLYLFSYSQHGVCYSGFFSFSCCKTHEYLALMLHWLPLNLLVVKLDIFIFN